MRYAKTFAIAAVCAAVLAGCEGASLKVIIEGLIAREQLGLIQEIVIHSAGDTLQMGDPGFEVPEKLSHDFTISKYEITNEQYTKFIDDGGYTAEEWWTDNGWYYTPYDSTPYDYGYPGWDAPDQPVSGVTWYEAVAFCNWRSAKEGLEPVYDKNGHANLKNNGYRLPTEVEWEYAASKGARGADEWMYPYGPTYESAKQVDFTTAVITAAVGSKSPGGDTREGVADMTGNVSEWCSDNVDADLQTTDRYIFYSDDISYDFILRGGSYQDIANANSTQWASQFPDTQQSGIGFRVVRTLP